MSLSFPFQIGEGGFVFFGKEDPLSSEAFSFSVSFSLAFVPEFSAETAEFSGWLVSNPAPLAPGVSVLPIHQLRCFLVSEAM